MGKRLSRGPPKLPSQQLAILAICRFAEPVAMTSVYPYLPEMIESFGIPGPDVAWWAGCTSAVFSLAQCLTAIIWGRASDYFGRKPTIITGLSFTMMSTVFWGLSNSLPMAITARAFAGGCNGNVGIIRTMVAEMVPEKELQPRAFSVMPLVWSLGSIFGPSFGGFFAKPAENLPGLFGDNRLMIRFPFLLPNLVASSLFLIGITTGILFLKETLETRRHKKDWGRVLGSRLVATVKLLFRFRFRKKQLKPFRPHNTYDESSASLLRPTSSSAGSDTSCPTIKESTSNSRSPKPPLARPTLMEVFTRQSVINLMAYTGLALHSIAYDQLLPNFLHLPPQPPNSGTTHLPFKFSGGFGLGSSRIGTLFTLYGISGCIIQFLIFPPVARKYGILPCFKACALSFPPLYLLTPYTSLLPTPLLQQAALCVLLIGKSFAVIFAFPCSVILLTNSAVSLRILGTLNGFAVSISAVGRAIGPAVAGATFSWGVKRGYGITPWFLLSFISALGAIPIWFLVEMDGFSTASESDDEEDLLDIIEEDEGEEIIDGDEIVPYDPYEEAIDTVMGPSLTHLPPQRRKSSDFGGFVGGGGERRKSSGGCRVIERRMSSPVGLRGGSVGPGGARKLSNRLGASITGQGTGGTSFV